MVGADIIAILLLGSPLLGALTTMGLCKKPYISHTVSCSCIGLSAICAVLLLYTVAAEGTVIHINVLQWVDIKGLLVYWSIHIDTLAAIMLIVVTFIALAVHIYSIGYMSCDEHIHKFFVYLSLFSFFMIMLVVSDNLLQLFFGWEGVGLCSYLLIGFWSKRESASTAAMKAFLVNRIGDIALILGIIYTFIAFGSFEFAQIFSKLPIDATTLTIICTLLFIGCMAKSAQVGMHIWLPSAMEGPVPASALIHAATMVTAGVFLLCRLSPLFAYSATTLTIITVVGGITSIFAASIALVQNDIKKIIAYSTCSQIGYMILAIGIGAPTAAMLHLVTHAFFKALLFLSAGNIIYALGGEQDITKMGGIRRKLPFTYSAMLVGSLSMIGIYPLAGFYSKNAIMLTTYSAATPESWHIVYWLGVVITALTAFYSIRLLNHLNKNAVERKVYAPPITMKVPTLLLTIGAISSGYICTTLGMLEPFWKNSSLLSNQQLTAIPFLSILAPIISAIASYILYTRMPWAPERLSVKAGFLYKILVNECYIDKFYNGLFILPAKAIGLKLWHTCDEGLIDGMPRGLASLSQRLASGATYIQSGSVYHYAIIIFTGLLLLLSWTLIGSL